MLELRLKNGRWGIYKTSISFQKRMFVNIRVTDSLMSHAKPTHTYVQFFVFSWTQYSYSCYGIWRGNASDTWIWTHVGVSSHQCETPSPRIYNAVAMLPWLEFNITLIQMNKIRDDLVLGGIGNKVNWKGRFFNPPTVKLWALDLMIYLWCCGRGAKYWFTMAPQGWTRVGLIVAYLHLTRNVGALCGGR